MKNVFAIGFLLLMIVGIVGAAEKDLLETYEKQKISYTTVKRHDYRYPLMINKFTFMQGQTRIDYKSLLQLTQDPILLKHKENIRKTRIIGFTIAGVLGASSVAFLIPSIVYIAQSHTYLPYNPVVSDLSPTGFAMIFLTMGSSFLLLADLIVTFSLIYAFRYRERFIKEAVDRYNRNLRKKLGLIPSVSMYSNNFFYVTCSLAL